MANMAVPNEKLLLSKNYVLKSPASKLLQRLVAEESLLTKLEHNDDSPVPSGVEHVAKQIADRRIAKHKDDVRYCNRSSNDSVGVMDQSTLHECTKLFRTGQEHLLVLA